MAAITRAQAAPVDLPRVALIALTVAGGVVAVLLAMRVQTWAAGFDFYAYWSVDPESPYGLVAPARGAFLYSPPMAAAMAPLGALPFDVARLLWTTLQAVTLAAMAGPLTLLVLVDGPVWYDLELGNVTILMAGAIVLGLRRYPGAWAFPILAKITPAVGLAWFVGRRDWRGLAWAGGLTAGICALSILLTPWLWIDWMTTLLANPAAPVGSMYLGPLWLRLPLAAGLAWYAGRRDWPWLVPVAVLMSFGHVWANSFAILVACIPLAWPAVRRRASSAVARGSRLSRHRTAGDPARSG